LSRKPYTLYYLGERSVNVKHAQLRLKCSKLNAHLFLLHVTDSPQCACGHNIEDSEHYSLKCHMYMLFRRNMLTSIQNIVQIDNLSTDILLHGSNNLDVATNRNIFESVHKYIIDTGRL
jgi:hypothetical protein